MSFAYKDLDNQELIINSNRKLGWISIAILGIASIIVIASVSTYLMLRDTIDYDYIYTTDNPLSTTDNDFDTTKDTDQTPTTVYPEFPNFFVNRENWGANPPRSNKIPQLDLPIKRIIIGHTGGEFCTEEVECMKVVRSIQLHDKNLDDIPYNFLIGGDGKVYEGRGFNYEGQHTRNKDATEYDSIGICIAFIGNYESTKPNNTQINILKDFIGTFLKRGLINEDHIIVSQDDLKYSPTKASALNDAVKNLENYRPLYKIYRREEWKAEPSRGVSEVFNRTMDWVLIGHTATDLCDNLTICAYDIRGFQYDAFTRGMYDTMHNIMFGGDGYAFEGRGWDKVAAHALGFNQISIGVGVIGTFSSIPPNENILNAMLQVFDDAMALGKLTDDYKIFGRSDFGGPGPGEAFMKIIREWCRHGNRTTSCDQTEPTTELTTKEIKQTTEDITDSTLSITTPEIPVIPYFFVTRENWGANPPRSSEIPLLDLPIKRIIIAHTGEDFCVENCTEVVRSIQSQDKTLDDIPYNFLIGGDGKVYEGRGFHFQGQHTRNQDATEYDSIGICIAFIGNYESIPPNNIQIEILKDFIKIFTNYELIDDDHIIVSQDDLKFSSIKGTALKEIIKSLEKFRPLYKIYRREEWRAQPSRHSPILFERTMDWVLIGHSQTPLCNTTTACNSRARSLQSDSFNRGQSDIMYNIMFGGDGYVLEGRGWDFISGHAVGFNDISIGVGAIGDFRYIPPNNHIVNAMLQVFDDAMALGKLTDDYKIFGRSDFDGPGPGEAFMEIIREWCRHGNRTSSC